MGKRLRAGMVVLTGVVLLAGGHAIATRWNLNRALPVGSIVDEFNGITVHFNGGVNQSRGRNVAADGYNLGIRHQCVEFVKRYYYERFAHRMPDSMGHARHFFDADTPDGALNVKRGLLQYPNGSATPPQVEDLIVFAPTLWNPYGHVAIVSGVFDGTLQVVQQNAGPFAASRATYALVLREGGWRVEGKRTLGWLRRPE